MELTRKQEEALRIAVERYKNKESYTCISGFAGAGKSTVIKFIIDALKLNPEDVAYVAFTGKAAEVLRRKGCPNACTAHKLLYYASKTPNGKFIFKPRRSFEQRYRLIVVDEVSMLPKDLWELLLSHKIHVIAAGDPGQLPPVSKDADNHVLDHPHIFLDEIMRQAQDSEIIRLSMDIREGRPIPYQKGNEVIVIPEKELVAGMYDWADQILVATNRKRKEINDCIRRLAGRGAEPEKGDKIISLSNHWGIMDNSGESALVNGTIGYLGDSYQFDTSYPIRNKNFPRKIPVLAADFISEIGDEYGQLILDYKALTTGTKFLSPENEYILYKKEIEAPLEFNYGYAITTHRAQGSEWNKILVFEEKFPFDREEHKRWLYTAVTRASEKLVLVR